MPKLESRWYVHCTNVFVSLVRNVNEMKSRLNLWHATCLSSLKILNCYGSGFGLSGPELQPTLFFLIRNAILKVLLTDISLG